MGAGTLRAVGTAMIEALDHLTLSGSAPTYETLLGRRVADGRLQTGNVGVVVRHAAIGRCRRWCSRRSSLDKAARLLERRGVATTKRRDAATVDRSHARRGDRPGRAQRQARSLSRDRRRCIGHRRARPRRHPHAQPRARRRLLCRPPRPRSSARPQQSRVGLAPAVLPLRRSRRRDRPRPEGRRVGRPRPPVGPVVAHIGHRQGQCAAEERPASTSRRSRTGRRPGHRGLLRQQPHRRRAHDRDRRR